MSRETLDSIKLEENVYITQTPIGGLKIFYLYSESNIPYQFRELINPKKSEYVSTAPDTVVSTNTFEYIPIFFTVET